MQSDRDLLRQALETLDAIAVHGDVACVVAPEKEFWLQPIITALRERLAQPEQAPVAWTPQVWWQFRPDGTLEFQKIKRTPNGAWEDYTTPPRREWVGLTDEECIAAIDEYFNFALDHGNVSDRSVLRYARAIEAKIKDKNA